MDPITRPLPVSDSTAGAALPPRDGWAVGAGRGANWWGAGWRLFAQAPFIWIAIVIVFGAIMFALAWVPFVGGLAQPLLYTVLGAGVLVGARAQDRGTGLSVAHLFSCCNEKALPLVILALIYIAGWFVLWLVAVALLLALVGFGTLTSMFSALNASDPMELWLALGGSVSLGVLVVLLVATLAAVPLIMAYWFAPALVVFRGDEPLAAMRASFRACLRNVPPFLVYSLIGVGLAIAATIPLALGWLVLLPMYGTSLYASYKDIFGEPA